MSIDHILQRHTSITPPSDTTPRSDADNVEDLGGWGRVRGQRDRSISLELRKRDDTVLAVPYSLIEQFLYSPADGITLRVAGRELRVRGRNLNDGSGESITLFSALVRHHVSWITEHSRSDRPAPPGVAVIESINW